jgi:hypothetical protein
MFEQLFVMTTTVERGGIANGSGSQVQLNMLSSYGGLGPRPLALANVQ